MTGTESPQFIDPRTTPFAEPRSRGELPHLYKEGGSYLVTFRLWDAVVAGARETLTPPPRGEAAETPSTRRRVRKTADEIGGESEPPLQLGSCVLARPKVAEVVQNALRFFHGRRYHLAAWCVMPNHAHAVFVPFGSFTPSDILHSWKSFTSHKVNAILDRTGALWERESFDHLIRSADDLEWFIAYVENNPVAAGLCTKPEDWPWSSARFRTPAA